MRLKPLGVIALILVVFGAIKQRAGSWVSGAGEDASDDSARKEKNRAIG